MEGLDLIPNFWKNRRVLITGHTGFKGSWLTCWLDELGAEVSGYALAPESTPNLWSLLNLSHVPCYLADICDEESLTNAFKQQQPEVVFHLAAQALVRPSYVSPLETFKTNVLGTATLLSVAAQFPSVKAIVVVTSDKCYENLENGRPYVESDPMGGHDPYSASKGCAELVTASMRRSFFSPHTPERSDARIASARAGNVIGGGDWSKDRLIPDIVRGCLGDEEDVYIRSPTSVRPWQHVLEPLHGYMLLAERLFDAAPGYDTGWNFGPDANEERPVIEVANALVGSLGRGTIRVPPPSPSFHEARLLHLDSSKARLLGWEPRLTFDEAISYTSQWYGSWHKGLQAIDLCRQQIDSYSTLLGSPR